VIDIEHRAIAHVAGGRRQRIAHHALANHGAAAVGRDQGRSPQGRPACHLDHRRVAFVPESAHASVGAKLDQLRQPLAAIEERAVDIGAMRHRVRVAEALGEALVERDVDHPFAAHTVEHEQALDEHRLFLH